MVYYDTLTIGKTASIGLDTNEEAKAPLHISGGNGDITNSEGDLKIGNDNYRLKIGVAKSGENAGDVRIRADGGTKRLMLGGGSNDTLTIVEGNVGIGNPSLSANLEVNGTVKASSFEGEGSKLSGIKGSQWNEIQDGISYEGNVSIGKTITAERFVGDGSSLTCVKQWDEVEGEGITYRSGYVGIGVIVPSEKLDVEGTVRASRFVGDGSKLTGVNQWIETQDKTGISYKGNVSIGTLNSSNSLTVNGSVIVDNGVVSAAWFSGDGSKLTGVKQWTDVAGGISYKAGNVGIGVDKPSGKLDVIGDIRAGNSDIYFTKVNHNFTGIGNTAGFAAIENAANYDALMILGRAGTSKGRYVRLWDYLQVNGSMDITGNVGIGRNPQCEL